MATASPHNVITTQPGCSGLGLEVNAMKVRSMKYYFVEFYNENINHQARTGPGHFALFV